VAVYRSSALFLFLGNFSKYLVALRFRMVSHRRELCANDRLRDGFFSNNFLSSVIIIHAVHHTHLFMRLLPT